MSDDVLTGRQVARLLKVSLRTVERLTAAGALPSFEMG
jgi:excisionase family DNA binding protein